MLGGKNRQPLGYTIIEVMIVLAVSGVMFLIAAQFVNGKQASTAFTSGVNEMASQLQDIVEQVTDGRYSDVPLSCDIEGSTTNPTAGSSQQGTNSDCVFLGKIVHFTGLIPTHNFEVFSLAGRRLNDENQPVGDIITAAPAVISSLTIGQAVPQSLDIANIWVNGKTTNSFAIAFIQNLTTPSDSDQTVFKNGTQPINLYYDQNDGSSTANLSYGASDLGTNLKPATDVDICLTDGTRYADILLGTPTSSNSASPLSVNVQMDDMTPCA